MSQFANNAPVEQTSYNDKASSSSSMKFVTLAPTNIFSVLNISESQNEQICTDLGFPSGPSVLDMNIKMESKAQAAPAAKAVPTPQSLLQNIAAEINLSADEHGLVQTIFGIVRQFANYSMSPDALVAGIQSAIKRVVSDTKKVVDFCKVITVVNFRLQNSEHKNALVALQISSNVQYLSLRLNDNPERPALLAPLCA